MKEAAVIQARVAELKRNLLIIEQRTEEELKKHFRKRDKRLLHFLYKEKSVWEYAIQQLDWVLNQQ
jgi:hypothetical protein